MDNSQNASQMQPMQPSQISVNKKSYTGLIIFIVLIFILVITLILLYMFNIKVKHSFNSILSGEKHESIQNAMDLSSDKKTDFKQFTIDKLADGTTMDSLNDSNKMLKALYKLYSVIGNDAFKNKYNDLTVVKSIAPEPNPEPNPEPDPKPDAYTSPPLPSDSKSCANDIIVRYSGSFYDHGDVLYTGNLDPLTGKGRPYRTIPINKSATCELYKKAGSYCADECFKSITCDGFEYTFTNDVYGVCNLFKLDDVTINESPKYPYSLLNKGIWTKNIITNLGEWTSYKDSIDAATPQYVTYVNNNKIDIVNTKYKTLSDLNVIINNSNPPLPSDLILFDNFIKDANEANTTFTTEILAMQTIINTIPLTIDKTAVTTKLTQAKTWQTDIIKMILNAKFNKKKTEHAIIYYDDPIKLKYLVTMDYLENINGSKLAHGNYITVQDSHMAKLNTSYKDYYNVISDFYVIKNMALPRLPLEDTNSAYTNPDIMKKGYFKLIKCKFCNDEVRKPILINGVQKYPVKYGDTFYITTISEAIPVNKLGVLMIRPKNDKNNWAAFFKSVNNMCESTITEESYNSLWSIQYDGDDTFKNDTFDYNPNKCTFVKYTDKVKFKIGNFTKGTGKYANVGYLSVSNEVSRASGFGLYTIFSEQYPRLIGEDIIRINNINAPPSEYSKYRRYGRTFVLERGSPIPTDFNWQQYIANYRDEFANVVKNELEAKNHWENIGQYEGRTYKQLIETFTNLYESYSFSKINK